MPGQGGDTVGCGGLVGHGLTGSTGAHKAGRVGGDHKKGVAGIFHCDNRMALQAAGGFAIIRRIGPPVESSA